MRDEFFSVRYGEAMRATSLVLAFLFASSLAPARADDAKTRAAQDEAERAAAKAKREAREKEEAKQPAAPRRVPGADDGLPRRTLPACVEKIDPEQRRSMLSEDDACLPAGPLAKERLTTRAAELRVGGARKVIGGWTTLGAGALGIVAIAVARGCVFDCEPLSKSMQAVAAISATAMLAGLIVAVVGHADRGLALRLLERVRAAPVASGGRVVGATLGFAVPF